MEETLRCASLDVIIPIIVSKEKTSTIEAEHEACIQKQEIAYFFTETPDALSHY